MNILREALESVRDFITPEQIVQVNNKYEVFDKLDDDEHALENESIVDAIIAEGEPDGRDPSDPQFKTVNVYKNLVYGQLSGDKIRRLNFFRDMANFPEVGDAIDEICDSCILFDENDEFIHLKWRKSQGISDTKKMKIEEEFDRFISLYDIDNNVNGWELFRNFIVDGELAWENIINSKKPELGIVKLNRIYPECYEYLINRKYEIVGILLNGKLLRGSDLANYKEESLEQNRKSIQNNLNDKKLWKGLGGSQNQQIRHNYDKRSDTDLVPMHRNQVTLINSGSFNEDKSIVYPALNKARRAYRQLQLIEDAVIIYRLVRAPERLVFNVPTGTLNRGKAEALVKKTMNKWASKKVYDPQTGTTTNDYDPHSLIDAYWFARPDGTDGVSVDTLAGGQNLGELDDLNYFLRKLYISLKIPYNRFNPESGGEQLERGESVTHEEYRFAQFIMRIQQQFAGGLYEAFIVHLKLIGLWDKFKLNRRMFFLQFTQPYQFQAYEQQQYLNMKMENFATVAENEYMSVDLACMEILGWSEERIAKNWEYIEKEEIRRALIERKVDNISDHGTPDELPDEDY